jgi:hypothetical protein
MPNGAVTRLLTSSNSKIAPASPVQSPRTTSLEDSPNTNGLIYSAAWPVLKATPRLRAPESRGESQPMPENNRSSPSVFRKVSIADLLEKEVASSTNPAQSSSLCSMSESPSHLMPEPLLDLRNSKSNQTTTTQGLQPAVNSSPELDSVTGTRIDEAYLKWLFYQKLTKIGRILIPQSGVTAADIQFSLHMLMSQDIHSFYQWYARRAGITEVLVLKFELLDQTQQRKWLYVVSREDCSNFMALKQAISGSLHTLVAIDPGPATFTLVVTPHQLQANGPQTLNSLSCRGGARLLPRISISKLNPCAGSASHPNTQH